MITEMHSTTKNIITQINENYEILARKNAEKKKLQEKIEEMKKQIYRAKKEKKAFKEEAIQLQEAKQIT